MKKNKERQQFFFDESDAKPGKDEGKILLIAALGAFVFIGLAIGMIWVCAANGWIR